MKNLFQIIAFPSLIKTIALVGTVIFAFSIVGCSKEDMPVVSNRDMDASLGIEAVPASLGSTFTSNFDGYTKVTTPNGGAIHIVAQNRITNEQMVRARSVLEHYLKNLPNSVYGADKSAIANQMATNNATLALLNGRDDGSNSLEVNAQYLFEEELQVEGHSWYMNQDYDNHRDATFEEILHLVHDTGIGVDGANAMSGAAPDFQQEIRAAQQNALSNNLWGIGASDWIAELTNENSLSQEYLAAVIDVYYGLWGADSNPNNGMSGLYVAKIRADIATEDPIGEGVLQDKFFHPYLTYNARIDASLNGNFSLQFDSNKPYTHHSRYLKDITLLGSNDNTVTVNELDNNITGNAGSNTIIFSGASTEYTINTDGDFTRVTDNTADRDGTNTLTMVEKLQFTDQTIDL